MSNTKLQFRIYKKKVQLLNTVLLNYIFYSWNYSVTLDSDKQQNRNILPFVLIYVFPKCWKQNSDVCI